MFEISAGIGSILSRNDEGRPVSGPPSQIVEIRFDYQVPLPLVPVVTLQPPALVPAGTLQVRATVPLG